MRRRKTLFLFALFVFLLLNACDIDPSVDIKEGNPPTFEFSPTTCTGWLVVYHIPKDQIDKNLPSEALFEINENTWWSIEGEHKWHDPITYGVVPSGMKEAFPAKPLIEGERYLVFTASLVGRGFVIKNGKAVEIVNTNR